MSTVKSKKLQVGTDANSANNFTLYQPSTPDGTLRIGVGNADNPTEVGQFNANGYKPATAPAFHATVTGSTSCANNTNTKIQFNTEIFDTTGDFDTTNYRFTPSVAGYYQINACSFQNGTTGILQVGIWRNGGQYKVSIAPVNNDAASPCCSIVMYFNGTTDYVEVYHYQTSGSTYTTLSSRQDLYHFSGHLIQQG